MPDQTSCHALSGGWVDLTARDWVQTHLVDAGDEGKGASNIIVYFSRTCVHCQNMLVDLRKRGPPPCADRVQLVDVTGGGNARTKYAVSAIPAVIVWEKPLDESLSYSVLYTFKK